MTWDDFYDRYVDWSETTVKSRISSLESIGCGEEVVDVVLNLYDDKLRVQMIRKAMKLGASFSRDDLMLLENEIPQDIYDEAVEHSGFSVDTLWFDENDFTWDDFCSVFEELPPETLRRCIPRLRDFGGHEEVTYAITAIYDADMADALYKRAVSCGVKFTKAELEEMGREEGDYVFLADDVKAFCDFVDQNEDQISENIKLAEQYVDQQVEYIKKAEKQKKKLRLMVLGGFVVGLTIGLLGGKRASQKGKHRGRCGGDCSKCPAHFGYRYGRWYYGHGHVYGCLFGGNRGR